jgi:polar amino acid transport system permease protein
MGQIVLQLFQSLGQTFKVFVLTLVFSLPLGFVVAAGRMSRHKLISVPVNLFIMIMRGTPLILQLLFVYFAPFYLFGVSFPRFTACIVAFVLNYSSYFAEIYRGGLQSIDRGQHEACYVLGLNRFDEFFSVKLPQVIRIVLPSIGNEVVTLVKDTALAQTIGVAELFRAAQNASSRLFSVTPIFIAGIFYFIMNAIVSKSFDIMEKRMARY